MAAVVWVERGIGEGVQIMGKILMVRLLRRR